VGDVEDVIADCGVYQHGRRSSARVPLEQAGDAARGLDDPHGYVWVGLHEPSADELARVAQAFDLPPLAVEDALKAHQRPKLEVYGQVLFMVLKPVRYVDHEEMVDVAEVALFVGPGFVVTVRHGANSLLRDVRTELDGAGSAPVVTGPAGVLYRVADLAVDRYGEVVRDIDVDIAEIEEQVFSPDEGDHAERIYKLKREVIQFRRALAPLEDPLRRLAGGLVPGIPESAAPFFRDVHDHLLRVADGLDSHDRLLTDVLQANVARVSSRQSAIAVRQNEDMRRISAWAAIALVPTAIAGIYGMNFDYIPELHWRYGYFAVLAVILIACLGLRRLFKRNGWL
jgi:magnesium transporter